MKKLLYFLTSLIFIAASSSNISATSSQGDLSDDILTGKDIKMTAESIISQMGSDNYREGEVLVKFRSGVQASSSLKVHDAVGASAVKRYAGVSNLELVELPEGLSVKDAVVQYMSDPNVEYAEPNYVRHVAAVKPIIPNDTYFRDQWALRNTGSYAGGTRGADIEAAKAWTVSVGNPNVVVAVLDTGIDFTHADLAGNIWRNLGETSCNDGIDNDGNGFIDDCIGWDFTTCDQFADNNDTCVAPKTRSDDPMDDNGHGTHVAGIIGAVGNNGNGTSGVMWTVQLMPIKVLNEFGQGQDSDIIAGIDYAILERSRGVYIVAINASFGGSSFSQAVLEAIQRANDTGILFVAAAGNGINNDGLASNNDLIPFYPASYNLPNIISVAATDQDDRRVPFSNFGLNSVHVAAPGVYIWSTVPTWWSEFFGFGILEFMEGTSMAAPHVSGLAGLLFGYYNGFQNTAFDHSQVRQTILNYVDRKPTLEGWIQTGGRINAYRSISSLLAPTILKVKSASSSAIRLKWRDNATGETGYKVERSTDGTNFTEIRTLSANTKSCIDSTVTEDTTYFYRVRAFNDIPGVGAANTFSFYSNTVSASATRKSLWVSAP
jgi:subtilisin family serine protease